MLDALSLLARVAVLVLLGLLIVAIHRTPNGPVLARLRDVFAAVWLYTVWFLAARLDRRFGLVAADLFAVAYRWALVPYLLLLVTLVRFWAALHRQYGSPQRRPRTR